MKNQSPKGHIGIDGSKEKIDAKIIAQFVTERKIEPQKKLPNVLIYITRRVSSLF
ncbi:MAG: hypothetical protein LBU34_07400 [Planctomycetaceae bacterium]|nr:hypothetical protein [Planctomycetaceae bacterium]